MGLRNSKVQELNNKKLARLGNGNFKRSTDNLAIFTILKFIATNYDKDAICFNFKYSYGLIVLNLNLNLNEKELYTDYIINNCNKKRLNGAKTFIANNVIPKEQFVDQLRLKSYKIVKKLKGRFVFVFILYHPMSKKLKTFFENLEKDLPTAKIIVIDWNNICGLPMNLIRHHGLKLQYYKSVQSDPIKINNCISEFYQRQFRYLTSFRMLD